MRLKTNKLTNKILLSFLMIMIFSLTLSYFNNIASVSWTKTIINGIYFLKKIFFVLCIIIVISNKKISIYSGVFCILCLFIWIMTICLFPKNIQYIEKIGIDIICAITSFMVILSEKIDFEEFVKISIIISRCLVILSLASLLTIDNLAYYMSYSYMVFSNAVMVPIGLIIYSAVFNDNIVDYCLGFGGLLFLLFLGSRGSFLALGLMAIFLFLIKSHEPKKLYGLVLIPILMMMMYFITSSGILGLQTSRILKKISSGTLFSSNDRLEIWKYLLECSSNDAFLGHGLCADRFYLPLKFSGADSTYAHNLFIELLIDFGIIGVFIFSGLVYLLIEYFRKEIDDKYKMIVVTFFFVSFFQLMYSRSFLTEANLFIMYGLVLMRLRVIKRNTHS